MLAIGLFEPPARLMAWFYSFTNNYIVAISIMALLVMIITAPLVLKSTKGMLEMQKLQPQMRKLQNEHRGDRQKLNEEMMKLYQEHKVNPLASCLPLVLQFPVFIIMFRIIHGLTKTDAGKVGFQPRYLNTSSKLYTSLHGESEMLSWGLDLARRPWKVIGESFGKGLIYALLIVALAVLYFVQQKMVAARATVAPTMSPTQQKLMQYLPVVFAVFLIFYQMGLVIYYMAQAIFRIGLQAYITRRFYHGDESLGRQAMAAGNAARELAKQDGGGGGLFAQAKRDLASGPKASRPKASGQQTSGQRSNGARSGRGTAAGAQRTSGRSNSPQPAGSKNGGGRADRTKAEVPEVATSKRVTPPKNRPTPANGRPTSTGRSGRPPGGSRSPRQK